MFQCLHRYIIRWLTEEKFPKHMVPICDFERTLYEIRIADVVLVEGQSRLSEVIALITQSPWSHAALYIGKLHDIENPRLRNLVSAQYHGSPDEALLIESVLGKGTVVTPLSEYARHNLRICRPKGLSRQDAQLVVAQAINKLGHRYDVRQILDLARFFFPWGILPRQFRSSLFTNHPNQSLQNVCSSMIAEAFASVEFPILPLMVKREGKALELINRNTKLFTPKDFDYSPYFDILKFPFLEIADDPAYRKLPWNKEGLMSNDHAGISSVKQVTDFEMDLETEKPKSKKPLSKLKKFRDRFARKKALVDKIPKP